MKVRAVQISLKILITLFLSYGILLVWTHEINFQELVTSPFKKIFHLNQKVEVPTFQAGIINLMRKYKEGLQVENLTWNNDYQECRFIFDNLTKQTEVTNFRIDLQLPAGVVYFEKIQAYGLNDLDVYSEKSGMGLGSNNQINKVIKTYSNHLHIKASKVFPQSHLTIKLIIKPTLAYNNGFVKYNYDYINENGNKIINDFVYLMPYHINDEFVVFTVNKEPVIGKYDYNNQIIPDTPLIFKQNGSVETAPKGTRIPINKNGT